MEVVFNTSSQNVCQISAFSAGRSINHDGCGSKTRTNRCGHVSRKGGMHRCSSGRSSSNRSSNRVATRRICNGFSYTVV